MEKIIHYCWFGRNKLSQHALDVIETWKKYAPGYEIKCWNEDNFNINDHPFTKAAYESERMAFVSDYVRFWAVYNYGGIYMDLGSELIKDIRGLVSSYKCISAIEKSTCTVNSGLFLSCEKHDSLAGEVLSKYDALEYVDSDDFRSKHTVNEMFTQLLMEKGFQKKDEKQSIGKWTILPSDCFNPLYGIGGFHIKKNTYSIHQYTASWRDSKERYRDQVTHRLAFYVGHRTGEVLSRLITEFKFENMGDAFRNLFSKLASHSHR